MSNDNDNDNDNNNNNKRVRVQLELPPEVRAFGKAVWWLVLGICFGMAIQNLAHVLARH